MLKWIEKVSKILALAYILAEQPHRKYVFYYRQYSNRPKILRTKVSDYGDRIRLELGL